jgi:RNA polymerase sigma-70 factor (ECF subfamily)
MRPDESSTTVSSDSDSDPTDADLVERMAGGDRDAFAALFRRHHATVFRFSRQMLGSKEVAEDVTQDVFMALAKNARRYEPSRGSLSTYLYGIARNLVAQCHRRSRARVEIDVDAIEHDTSPALTVSRDPVDELLRERRMQSLRLAILRLPVHYRETIVLCELHSLSYEEAAAIVGCPIGTIRSRLNRARQLLVERCRLSMGVTDVTEVWKPCLTPTKNRC